MRVMSASPRRIRAGMDRRVPDLLSTRKLSLISKDDIRQAQLELRHAGLYSGSLDGLIGPQTKQALMKFQQDYGLERTATLDGSTMVTMYGNIGTSEA
jgi:peptidoglycan hydrolase-like protein with peptidoglycan-binding domain